MHVALVGGSGFLGCAIAANLARLGHSIDILDIAPPPEPLPGVSFVCCDITDVADLQHKLSSCDAVALLAGLLDAGCRENPMRAWQVNVTGTLDVVKAVAASEQTSRLIFLSSSMVYDMARSGAPLKEDAAVVASSLYTASKLAIEFALGAATEAGLFSTLVLRPFTVYGPGPMNGERGHFIGRWLSMARAGEPLTVHGDGQQVIDLVPVEVVAELCAAFLDRPASRSLQVINATGGGPITVARIARCFQDVSPDIAVQTIDAPAGSAPRGWGDPTAMLEWLDRERDDLVSPDIALRTFLESSLNE